MSGQLVGEVLDAAEAGLLDKLSPAAFATLIAIAEKCHYDTRRGTVRRARICAAIHTHNSERTAKRAVRELKDSGIIRVVKNGYKAPGGPAVAATYELGELGPFKSGPSSELKAQATTAGPCSEASWGQNGPSSGQTDIKLRPPMSGPLDGIDGNDGGRSRTQADERIRHSPPTSQRTTAKGNYTYPRQCSKHPDGNPLRDACGECGQVKVWNKQHEAEIAEERSREHQEASVRRRNCNLCDEAGWLNDDDGLPVEPAIKCTHQGDGRPR